MDNSGIFDEGFDEFPQDFPEEFPFWYATPSGVQTLYSNLDSINSPLFPPNVFFERKKSFSEQPISFHDQDSVLHYFIATSESEELLDKYISGIISG